MEQSETEIDELVARAQNDDAEAFGELYDVFLEPIYRYIYFRVSRQEIAEDITSDVFFKMLKAFKRYTKKENMPFSAWLFRIAKNTLIDHYRTAKTTEEIPEYTADESRTGDTSQETVLQIERKRLLKALQSLPEMQAQALVLRYFSEQKNSEIATILEKSETAVRILQSRGLKKLHHILES